MLLTSILTYTRASTRCVARPIKILYAQVQAPGTPSVPLLIITGCWTQPGSVHAALGLTGLRFLQYNGQHPLRERAKKLDQGILVIRFEMPFNVWCNGCGHLIGKGVRFNAEKKAIGNYYSTKIWSFSMTSPCCQEHIEVQTDPKNHEYIVVAGARRKVSILTTSACAMVLL